MKFYCFKCGSELDNLPGSFRSCPFCASTYEVKWRLTKGKSTPVLELVSSSGEEEE